MAREHSCGMASTSGRDSRRRWQQCCAASADQPLDGADTMQADPQDSDSDSEAEVDMGDLTENIE